MKIDSKALDIIDYRKIGINLTILDITFKTGMKYRYYGVPQNIFDELINAESKGKYFGANIRNRYKFEKIG